MAYNRLSEKKVIATNLNSYIQSQILLITKSRLRRELEDEAEFNRAILVDNLTLDQQLDWRKDQLERVERGDKDGRRKIRGEISTLKDLIEQKGFQDDYYDQVLSLNEGMQSIDTTMVWLKDKLARTTDSNIKNSIKENISKLETYRYEQRKSALQSQTNYANNDKTQEVIEKQITRINDERVKSAKAGNEDYTVLLDLQLQSLQKTMNESNISKTMLDFSVSTMTGQSSTALLNQFNSQIEGADQDAPINIGGTKYESTRQFWELKRGEYLNDRSANGFFPRYNGELKEQIDYKTSRGVLTNASLSDVKSFYETIKDRPELADYHDRIAKDQQSSLQTAANVRSSNILNEFAIKQDAKKALGDLAYLQDTYSVDQSLNYQKIVSSAASEKESQINQILSTMSAILKDNPGISNQQAMEQAIASGSGAQYSPEELATKKASEVITEAGEKATEQQFGEKDSKFEVPKKPEFESPEFKEGGVYKMPNDTTVYKYEGGQLHAFTEDYKTEEQFKQASGGKGFSAVETVKNISGTAQGSVIPASDYPIKPEEYGERVFHADLLKYYKPEQIMTKGTDKYLKAGTKPIWGNKIGSTEWGNLQKEYDSDTLESKVVRAGKDIYYKK